MRLRLLGVGAALSLAACSAGSAPPAVPTTPSVVDVQILAFNDFHGHLEPPAGSNGRIRGVDAGGAGFLATHVRRLKADNPHTILVSAGDNIGATPLVSALFHDEPAIEALNAIGLELSTVGNHEFDEGWRELLRMQRGGCHPVDGCRSGSSFPGASFTYLSANVRVDAENDTLFPATAIRTFEGVPVGFIGLALAETPSLVQRAGIEGLTFLPEADTANAAAERLRQQGVEAIVVLVHQGGIVESDDEQGCRTMRGGLVPMVERLSNAIDVVVSGHTNRVYTCEIAGKLVTSAASYGRLITDIDLTIDRRTRAVVSKTARNVVVSRDVEPDAAQAAILERYRPLAAEIGRRPVGSIAASVTRGVTAAGESAMGDVVADALLAVTKDPSRGGAQVAFVNQGGLRADLVHPGGATHMLPHEVTYGDVFSLLPFGNTVIVKTMTGDALARMLEQQFDNPSPGLRMMLQVSEGFSYTYDFTQPAGTRVDRRSITLHGRPVQPHEPYRVAMFDFLWGGGDGFTSAADSTDAVAQGLDIDVFLEYLATHSPVSPGPRDRIRRVR
jgi:5'-nucleotidase